MTEPGNGNTSAAAAGSAAEEAISHRARAALASFAAAAAGSIPSDVVESRARDDSGWPHAPPPSGPSEGLLASLRHHLLAGETHYPDRPGMADLRRRVGEALPDVGFPAREPDGVLITQGEGESLFATLLGLGGGEGATIMGEVGGRHQRLLDWMRVRVIEPGGHAASGVEPAFHLVEYEARASIPANGNASDTRALTQVHAIGDRLFSGARDPRSSAANPVDNPRAPAPESLGAMADAIVIGSLDGLAAMHPFSLGFVAAPVAVRPRIAKWKQASSICSPAPSQRAALWALGARP